ncbi:MAG: hypothetical protein ACK4VO_08715 [Pseudobdellovibrio sp.]
MKNTWIRLLLAAFVSLTSLAIVQIWFDLTTPESLGVSAQEPIAYIRNVKDEVDKRPIKRQVWQSLTKGDYIFSGEAIRTAKNSEVQVEFVNGGHSINIEPDSIVLIAQNSNKELALDLMEGGATVTALTTQTASEATQSVSTINLIQNGKTVLIKGHATLTKANNGSLEIQSSDITQNINPFFTMMNDTRMMSFKLVSPLKDKHIFSDGDSSFVKIQWANVPKDLLAKVALGSDRSILNLIREVQPGQSSIVDYNLSAGFYFYKIFFINPMNNKIVAESKLQKIKIIERSMPVVINPTLNQIFDIENVKQKIEFNWTEGEFVKNYILDLYKDAGLKSRIISKNFDKHQRFSVDLPEGEYFYRLSAKFETENKFIPGRIEKFVLNRKSELSDVIAKPVLLPPQPVVAQPVKIEPINWIQTNYLDDRGAEEQKYVGQPELEMKWEALKGIKVSEYRIKLTPQNQNGSKPIELKTSQSIIKAKLLKPGRYIASIEGIDQSQKIIGSSNPKAFIVSELPMLSPPEFVDGNSITANKKGDFQVKWLYLDGAIKFRINLFDSKGKQVFDTKYTRTGGELSAKFEDLPPGEYKFEIAGMDKAGRFGAVAKKTVNVLDATYLIPPKLKPAKVK